jgi:hypothetical protein
MDLAQLLRALGLQQAYQSYQQNIGQPFANIAGPFGRGLLGLERPEYGEEQAYRTGQAIGNMPAVSAPVGAFKAAAQVPGLLADASQAMKGLDLAGLLGLTAYHGSPYRFSKFDPTKIGTGEGAQAYGYGHYFAEAPGVAKGYQSRLSSDKGFSFDGKSNLSRSQVEDLINEKYGTGYLDNVLRPSGVASSFIDDMITGTVRSEGSYPRQYKPGSERAKLYDELRGKITHATPGSFYTVDIPDEMIGRMLDWDKPISEQKAIFDAINNSLLKSKYGLDYSWLTKERNDGKIFTGKDLYESLLGERFISDGKISGIKKPEASELLRQAGIPGISYLDQGSRGAGQGTRNFVVFPGEEEAIKMLKVE